jgi:hypothetical protein
MSSKWALLERFEITDASGALQFEARGHLGSQITLHDSSGRELADIRKPVFSDTHEVFLAGQRAAVVRHAGIFGDRYEIETSAGQLTARGRFGADGPAGRRVPRRAGRGAAGSPAAGSRAGCSGSGLPSRGSWGAAAGRGLLGGGSRAATACRQRPGGQAVHRAPSMAISSSNRTQTRPPGP